MLHKVFTSRAAFGNGGGDLIGGLVTRSAGVQWLPPGLEDRRGETREGDSELNYSLRGREGGRAWKVPVTHGVHCLSYRKPKKYLVGVLRGRMSVKRCNMMAEKRFLVHSRQLFVNKEGKVT